MRKRYSDKYCVDCNELLKDIKGPNIKRCPSCKRSKKQKDNFAYRKENQKRLRDYAREMYARKKSER